MVNQIQNELLNSVSWFDVTEHQDGQRIDNFLFRYLKGVPKSRVYRILRKGEVRVNKGRVKPEYKLKLGDKLRIPPIRIAQSSDQAFTLPQWVRDAINAPIFEDDSLIVINKPAGLAVHGGSGIAYGLIEAMRQLKPSLPFLELVHRIDRETSGCVVLAKSRPVLNDLHLQFRREQGKVEKSYLAIVHGALNSVTTVTARLKQTRDNKGMKRCVIDEKGQSAKSTVMPVRSLQSSLGSASYVRIQLYTGRMHQARVHCKSLDLPIIGDKLYGDWNVNRALKPVGVNRCLLHAERYQLTHPVSGKLMRFDAPIAPDFTRVLENLST